MTRESILQGTSHDIEAVCNIAHALLGLSDITGVRGTMGRLAEDFTGASPNATVDDLLQVPPRTRNHIRYLADDKLFSINSFSSAQHHSAYAPLISFVPSLGSGKMILGNNLRGVWWDLFSFTPL